MKILLPILVILAIATSIPAWLISPQPIDVDIPEIEDRHFGIDLEAGEDALEWFGKVGTVEVATWDEERSAAEAITVTRSDDKERPDAWVIASRFNYPADGDGKVGKVVAQIVGVSKAQQVTSDPIRHADLGVIDPTAEGSFEDTGRGTRVTIKDRQGGDLVDVVIGDQVPDTDGYYYVREAGENEVFTGQLAVKDPDSKGRAGRFSISSRFIDWVEPNPFGIKKADVRQLQVHNYSIDPQKGTFEGEMQSAQLVKPKSADSWDSDTVPEGHEVDGTEVDKIVQKLSYLRLADVAQVPPFAQELQLQNAGFYIGRQGGQVAIQASKEGSMTAQLKNGFRYSFFFGMPAGSVTAAEGTAAEDDEGESDRLMFVIVGYDKGLDETKPKPPMEPVPEEGATELTDEQEKAYAEKQQAYEKELQKHLSDAGKKVNRLNRKYTGFFYVIRDYDFDTLRPEVDRLYEAVEKQGEEDGASGGQPLPDSAPPAAP